MKTYISKSVYFSFKHHQMKNTFIIVLWENFISNKVWDICLEYDLTVQIKVFQYWSLCYDLFEILKCFNAVLNLCKWNLLLSKSNKRFNYFEEVLYESIVKVNEVYKTLNLFKISQSNSVYNCFNLLRIHT